MNSHQKRDNSLLFNLITLLAFGFGLFLIIFLKRGEGKKFEQGRKDISLEKSRVKNSKQLANEGRQIEKVRDGEENLNERQIKILKRIEQEGAMDPSEIYELVPGVSTRTVRRDMDKLVKEGFVSQRGTTKSTQYIFKG